MKKDKSKNETEVHCDQDVENYQINRAIEESNQEF